MINTLLFNFYFVNLWRTYLRPHPVTTAKILIVLVQIETNLNGISIQVFRGCIPSIFEFFVFFDNFSRLKRVEAVGRQLTGSFLPMVMKPHRTDPTVSPVSSSSPTLTHRIEKGGSKCWNLSSGDLLQLVTNFKKKKAWSYISKSCSKILLHTKYIASNQQ